MNDFKIHRGFIVFIDNFRRVNGEQSLSNSFVSTMCKKLDEDFYKKTGIRISKSKGKINFGPFFSKDLHSSFEGNIGTFKGNLGVDILIVGHDIKWQSKKEGKLIYPHDEVNEDEIDFWFDHVLVKEAKEKWRELPPKLGVKIKPLHYDFKLESYTEHFYLCIYLKDQSESSIKEVETIVSQLIVDWNNASLDKNKDMGVVHSWEIYQSSTNFLIMYIDFGSASEKLLKQILETLNDLEGIEKVTITSFPDEE